MPGVKVKRDNYEVLTVSLVGQDIQLFLLVEP